MHPYKSSGPDGMAPDFIINYGLQLGEMLFKW